MQRLHRTLRALLALSCAGVVAGCAAKLGDDHDPAAWLEGEEWSDEGPPADLDDPPDEPLALDEEVPEDDGGELGVAQDALSLSRFQLPFPCGQTWAGQTRTNHSPLRSVDFNRANDIGDPVVAAAPGTVTRVRNEGNRSYGRWIEIAHGDGYTTRYAHLASQGVSVGQRVAQGQRIGTVGSTGGSTGPHLHYELRRFGSAIWPFFDGRRVTVFGTRNYRSNNRCGGGGATGHPGRIDTSGARLNVRSGPGTGFRIIGTVADGANVRIRCQTTGTRVTGTFGTTRIWDRLGGGGYVSDAYVFTGSDGRVAPDCR